MRVLRMVVVVAVLAALAVGTAAPASATPVARNDTEYAVLGRVFPDIERTVSFMKYADELVPALGYFERRYPDRVSVDIYGKSFDGRALYVVEITDERSPVPYAERRKVLVDASIHASERIGAEGALRFAEDLAATRDPHLLALLRETVLVLSLPNPDGWVKGDATGIAGHTRETSNGVDPNRNFPSTGYARIGWRPMSEPEAIATHALYNRDRYAGATWGASIHCFTTDPRSFVQVLLMAGEYDVRESLANQRFGQTIVDRVTAATSLEPLQAVGAPAGMKPGMYGTVWETRRKLNTGFLGNWLAMDAPVGLGLQGPGLEHWLCENIPFTHAVVRQQVAAVKAELRALLEAAVRDLPEVAVDLPGKVGYLHDPSVVTDADDDGPGYRPANALEASYGQAPYTATRMRFFDDLAPYTAGRLQPLAPTALDAAALSGLSAVVASETLGGADPAVLADYVRGGGTLVLTDGAVAALSDIAGLPSSAVARRTGLVARMAEASRDFSHPLLTGLDRPDHYAEQLYEPVPLGFSLDANASPWWSVDPAAFAGAGGRVAALDPGNRVMVGDLPLGAGRVVVVGGLLPQPSEAYFHPYGLGSYAVTYTGYQVLLNALGATVDVTDHPLPAPVTDVPVQAAVVPDGATPAIVLAAVGLCALTRRRRLIR
jgi:hypothetical protein